MQVLYNGTLIELETPEEDEQTLDILTRDYENNIEDTIELTEEELEKINSSIGESNE